MSADDEQRLLRLEAAESRRQTSDSQRRTMEEWRRDVRTSKLTVGSVSDTQSVHEREESDVSEALKTPYGKNI